MSRELTGQSVFKKLNQYQLNYSVVEKEALAVIWALQHFAVYVGSGVTPVVVYADHNPLTFLHTLRCPKHRLIRWSLFLQSHDDPRFFCRPFFPVTLGKCYAIDRTETCNPPSPEGILWQL